MKILDSCYAFSKILCSDLLAEPAFFFEHRIDLTFGTILKNEVEIVVILIMIVQFKDVIVIKLVHYFNLQLYLLNQIMF